jgi:RecJ-like exonuclease
MLCPECAGIGTIARNYGDIVCPVCQGVGEVPDKKQMPGSCLACGESIPIGYKYCAYHYTADKAADRAKYLSLLKAFQAVQCTSPKV